MKRKILKKYAKFYLSILFLISGQEIKTFIDDYFIQISYNKEENYTKLSKSEAFQNWDDGHGWVKLLKTIGKLFKSPIPRYIKTETNGGFIMKLL